MTRSTQPKPPAAWRHGALALVLLGPVLGLAAMPPTAQAPSYHLFADTRALLGIPNALDVLTNLPFTAVGIAGVLCAARRVQGGSRHAWLALFTGIALVSIGSAYYHWAPDSDRLVWDRAPMTVGFMGLLVALLAEDVHSRLARLLVPALALGLASVAYWDVSGDLRLYYWVQLAPLVTIPAVAVLYRARYSHRWLPLLGLGWYVLAKLAEGHDGAIFAATGELLSGHSAKHLLASAGCASLLAMVYLRQPLAPPGASADAEEQAR